MANNQLNSVLQNIAMAKKQGKNPKMIMNMIMQQNPQMQQTLTQLQNMANGRNPKEFIMQIAKQNGIDEVSIGIINEILNN
jgi:hypothetical protein